MVSCLRISIQLLGLKFCSVIFSIGSWACFAAGVSFGAAEDSSLKAAEGSLILGAEC